ncbi:LuxR family transcriptional regulator [Pseudonocardia sp. KRD291]|uniref:helix-turn-helix transcriptional regulator n=1 Tax=Pseudonocardia sp. KRD291 TaxID=2792007 RepID=UPI001C4A3048|nr:LuxR family transcriptional regulator [Pseudonocardia sp. KRD291]MBW0103626.1 AAA family ATPase [Pseudonocardia sp. KRD291]
MEAPSLRLVDRDGDLARLRHRARLVAEGRGPSSVLVRGAAGIGKTALLDEFADAHDGPVLRARGAGWESDRPHGVLSQLLRSAVPPADPFDAADLLVGALAAGTVTLAVVDDAHCADVDSLRTLSTAVAHHHTAPLLVLLAARVGEAPAATADVLTRTVAETLDLGALGSRAVAELAAARRLPLPDRAAERLRRHTGGIPRHVLALLEEMPAEAWADPEVRLPPPSAVAVAVGERLSGVGHPARALTEAVAVLGGAVELHEAGRLAGLDDLLVPLEEAARAGLVVRAGGHLGPMAGAPDPMVRAAVIDVLGPDAAATLRRRAAGIVTDPVRGLGYLAAATPGRDAELADRLDAQARAEADDGAWRAAASLLRAAGRLTEDRDLREQRVTRAVDAMVGAGDGLAAASMIPVVESLRETPLRNAVLGYLAVVRGRAGEAESRLGRAWEQVDCREDPGTAAMICQRNVLHALARCRGEELVTWSDRTAELVGPDAPAAVEASAIRGLGLASAGRPAEAVEEYRAVTERVDRGAQGQRATMGKGWLHVVVDCVDDALSELASAVPTTHLGGSSRISLWALGWLARARFLCGEWDRALAAVEEGRALGERTGTVLAGPLLEWTATQVYALRGDRDLAERSVRSSEAGILDYEIMRVPCLLARAQVGEARADYAQVLRVLEPLTRSGSGSCLDEPGWWPWTDVYANALVMEGRLDDAEEFLVPHEARALDREHRSTRARLGYARGRLHGARGDVDAAHAAFEASLALIDGMPLRHDRARITFAHGQTLRRAGRRRDADAVLTDARDQFASLGAQAYVLRCDRELKAGGVHAAGSRSGGRDERGSADLTPQETAVTDLVARGMSNREVGAELHVSTKTVQYHLTRIYAKLGIRSRAELAAQHSAHAGDDDGPSGLSAGS